MRLTQIAMLIAAATSLAACQTTSHWIKPGATQIDYQRDRAVCEYEALKATPPSNERSAIAAGLEEGLRQVQLIKMCLSVRGWTLVQETPQ